MALYNSFGAVASAWRTKHNTKRAKKEALDRGSLMMLEWIKKQHGGGNTRPATGPLQSAIKGHSRPLLHKGGLRAGVVRKQLNSDITQVYQKNKIWAHIHEYGASWAPSLRQSNKLRSLISQHLGLHSATGRPLKNITIPPRPIWSRAKPEYGRIVIRRMKQIATKHLTN